MRRLIRRSPPTGCLACSFKAGIGGLLAIAMLALAGDISGNLLAVAPLAASCVLVFAAPDSPMAQPANVVGGHLLSTTVALIMDSLLPGSWWAAALGVGVVIALMGMARVTHPPAGADALVVLTTHPGVGYLVFPIAIGSIAIVATGIALHRLLPPRAVYPRPAE